MKELELRTKQMTSLNEMGSLLACSGTIKEACAVVADSLQKLFLDAPSGALYLFKSSRDLIEAAVSVGKRDVSAPTFPPDACGLSISWVEGLAPPSCRTCSAHHKKGTLTKPGCPDRQNREV